MFFVAWLLIIRSYMMYPAIASALQMASQHDSRLNAWHKHGKCTDLYGKLLQVSPARPMASAAANSCGCKVVATRPAPYGAGHSASTAFQVGEWPGLLAPGALHRQPEVADQPA